MTPVVPYSASNYLLGMTHLPIAPYLTGSAVRRCWPHVALPCRTVHRLAPRCSIMRG